MTRQIAGSQRPWGNQIWNGAVTECPELTKLRQAAIAASWTSRVLLEECARLRDVTGFSNGQVFDLIQTALEAEQAAGVALGHHAATHCCDKRAA